MMGYNYGYSFPPPPLPTGTPPPPPPPPPPPLSPPRTTSVVQSRSRSQPPNGYMQEQQQQQQQWPHKGLQFPDFSRPPPPLPGKYRNYSDSYDMPRSGGHYNQNSTQSYSHRYMYRTRYNGNNNQYGSSSHSQPSWQRHPHQNSFKKPRLEVEVSEPKTKAAKKKKPLSQAVPARRSWTPEEAERALSMEKDYNKRTRNHSLIVKFPDLELNKEIVAKFHDAIESVHFQQPSTARFCFISLRPSVDADAVIKELNLQKFGDGFLCAEYKKDREEDQVVNPTDIDPLTLYVGNLTQEVTKEDMVRTFPESRRIDIGYAKKMKFTRYAFVSFKDVGDCMKAFKRTHGTEMHSKSLIVRFRRINGPNGMPGETKVQNQSTRTVSESTSDGVEEVTTVAAATAAVVVAATAAAAAPVRQIVVPSDPTPPKRHADDEDDDVMRDVSDDVGGLSSVKSEPKSDEENERECSVFGPGSIEAAWARHRPMIKTEIKCEAKSEIKSESATGQTSVKDEPLYEEDEDAYSDLYGGNFECVYQNESENDEREEDDDYDYDDEMNELEHVTDFNSLYQNMVSRASTINSVKRIRP